ncbi:TssA family type VI secretion system protein [Pseudoalteromonas luteoviolacea]|uniref:TssA family type VI secretion system protein n=1 Tax=Pseudoalteromonas luteoviolacea TaxID=43657 RepID=UPI001F48BDBD|nr:TssA family type VI secretion system protein [Pseudoalteromonas luteoviolacea]MCF6441340.1 TssA family type VI secretion system protein [Pseudoalteromonas luteoviolacea]
MTQPHGYPSWQAWSSALLSEFEPDKCGEDVRYDDDFKCVKASSSGASEVDFKEIFIISSKLLAEKTKDLRVASYLCLAATQEFGINGLLPSLRLFNDLVKQFDNALYPEKPRARASVHTWFLQQQQRLLSVADNIGGTTPEHWQTLDEILQIYAKEIVPFLDDQAGPLADLGAWCEKGRISQPMPKPEPKPEPKPVTQEQPQPAPVADPEPAAVAAKAAEPIVVPPKVTTQAIDSDSDYMAQVRTLLKHDRAQQNWPRAMHLARAVRWGALALPPHDDNLKTRLPAPRETAFAPIKNALANEEYTEALAKAEALFMEGAMHFNLDLQKFTLDALAGLSKSTLKGWLELQLAAIAQQFPKLLQLKYEDGSDFCSAANRERIQEHALFQGGQSQDAGQQQWQAAMSEAQKLVDDNELKKALQLIDTQPMSTAFDKACARLHQGRLLLRAERASLAVPIFQQLLSDIQTHRLDLWQEDFAMDVWRYAKQCFEEMSQTQGDEFDLQVAAIESQLLVTKVSSAIDWV